MRDSGCVAAKRREGDKCGGRETGDEVRYVNEKEEGKKREKVDDDVKGWLAHRTAKTLTSL